VEAYNALCVRINDEHAEIGCRGIFVFADLSYFQCALMSARELAWARARKLWGAGGGLDCGYSIFIVRPGMSCLCGSETVFVLIVTRLWIPLQGLVEHHALTPTWMAHWYTTFFHYAVAHLLLSGVLKDFFNFWLRAFEDQEETESRRGAHEEALCPFIMPQPVREEIVKRGGLVIATKGLQREVHVPGSVSIALPAVPTRCPFRRHDAEMLLRTAGRTRM
jgi:hypothetical protein